MDYEDIDCPRYDFWVAIQVSSRFALALLEIISGIFLAFAVFKIRALIKMGTTASIDMKILVSHVVIFSLFLISVVVSYTYYAVYKWGPNSLTREALDKYDKAVIASNVISFFAQLGQIWILSHFAVAPDTQKDRTFSLFTVSENGDDADCQD